VLGALFDAITAALFAFLRCLAVRGVNQSSLTVVVLAGRAAGLAAQRSVARHERRSDPEGAALPAELAGTDSTQLRPFMMFLLDVSIVGASLTLLFCVVLTGDNRRSFTT
jgi:hypothetical protein